MTLPSGTTLGPYEILSPLGAGGMGEAYRARDTKLKREVALKVLPEAFTADAERMARFEREARVLASLNHPNIAAVYGLEESAGTRALVMELVEGGTLAERIAQGPIPLEEALPIAKQVAEALEYAHEKGIIHRDLKPANIKVTPEGAVKVLDFGLAKGLEDSPTAANATNSPTLSLAATKAGIILGTAAYMAPEQARGKTVDRRADIWAFGVVLYEMITGQRPFQGDDVSETLAAVIKEEPDWKALPADTPAMILLLLRRCLAKDSRQRLRDIGDARLVVEEHRANPAVAEAAESARPSAVPKWIWIAITIPVLASAVALAGWYRATRPGPPPLLPLQRFDVDLGLPLAPGYDDVGAVISPDGTQVAFTSTGPDGTSRLYKRLLAQPQAEPLPGTEGASAPFFSPDGQWLAFFARFNRLQKISLQGGTPVDLCDLPAAQSAGHRGGWW